MEMIRVAYSPEQKGLLKLSTRLRLNIDLLRETVLFQEHCVSQIRLALLFAVLRACAMTGFSHLSMSEE